VPQVMRGQAVEPGRPYRRVECAPSEAAQQQRAPLRRGEHERLGVHTGDLFGQAVDEGPRDRHRAPLVSLGRAPHCTSGDLGHGLGHSQPPPEQVDAADPQRRQLPISQAGQRQDLDDEAVLAGRAGKRRHIAPGQEMLLTPGYPRQRDALGGVRARRPSRTARASTRDNTRCACRIVAGARPPAPSSATQRATSA